MQVVRAGSAAALSLLLAALVPAYGQRGRGDDNRDKDRGGQQEGRPQERHPQHPGQSARQQQPQRQERSHEAQPQQPQRQERSHEAQPQRAQQPERFHEDQAPRPQAREVHAARPVGPPRRTEQRVMSWQQQRGWARGGGWGGHPTWHENRARRWEIEHRTWVQRGGYGGYYIPDDRFRLHFGPPHRFRMHAAPVIYMGYPRFSYGGFSFLLVDPWPESWPETWYNSDDLYIDYNDGYYLYNSRHAGFALAISVVL